MSVDSASSGSPCLFYHTLLPIDQAQSRQNKYTSKGTRTTILAQRVMASLMSGCAVEDVVEDGGAGETAPPQAGDKGSSKMLTWDADDADNVGSDIDGSHRSFLVGVDKSEHSLHLEDIEEVLFDSDVDIDDYEHSLPLEENVIGRSRSMAFDAAKDGLPEHRLGRSTVADGRFLRSEPPSQGGGRTTLLEFPDVAMLVHDLQGRVEALDSLYKNGNEGAAPQDYNNGAGAGRTVTMTPEQQRALAGLEPAFRGLIRCLKRAEGKILLAVNDDDGNDDEESSDGSRSTLNDSMSKLRIHAKTPSKRNLLDKILRGRRRGQENQRRGTVFASNGGMRTLGGENSTALPRGLIKSMIQASEDSAESTSARYLANEYGGVELPTRFQVGKLQKRMSFKVIAKSISNANTFVGQVRDAANVGRDELEYLPREFSTLSSRERRKLANMLSWNELKKWGFDAFLVNSLSTAQVFRRSSSVGGLMRPGASDNFDDSFVESTIGRGCPLVLMGWAILASPYAQLAMARNVEDEGLIEEAMSALRQRANTVTGKMAKSVLSVGEDSEGEMSISNCSTHSSNSDTDDAWSGGYFLPDTFKILPRSLCRFLRRVEKEYSPRSVNPYHNNIHAADVLQSTHSLIQMGGGDMELAYGPLEIYSILLSAVCHDIRHPGTNNNYQVTKSTELSLMYNDISVLENMHASRASFLLLGIEDGGVSGSGRDGVNRVGGSGINGKDEVLGTMTQEQRKMFRASMLRSIMSTDMSNHFESVAKITDFVVAVENEIAAEAALNSTGSSRSQGGSVLSRISSDKHQKLHEKFLPFVLHIADISNAAKPHDVSLAWMDAVYDEFFLQGDRERAEGLPVSPLCDRDTTSKPEAQVGFMAYVVKPAFVLLGKCIPEVRRTVLEELERNLKYWEGEKAKAGAR